jgi:alternate signal-mediated exported protein
MNKIVKASIATTAGVILLLGGAGTFATWNSSADTESASIVAGNLVVEANQDGAWTANGAAIEIDGYRIVPGDVLTYTETMKVGAEGDSLSATLALTESSIAAADPENDADRALAGYLLDTAVLSASGTGISGEGPTFTVAPGAGVVSEDVTVTVEITFPAGEAGANNDAMNGAVTLDALTVSLTQNVD